MIKKGEVQKRFPRKKKEEEFFYKLKTFNESFSRQISWFMGQIAS
jgi:hypothetical protein